MATPFPAIEPSSRSFKAPRWATSGTRSQSGVVTRRLWGSQPSQGELTLSFTNIKDDVAQQILSAYDSAKGPTSEVELPPEVFKGTKGLLNLWLTANLSNKGLRWYFSENDPPSVESIVPGISSVRVSLVAELRLN